MRLDNLPKVIIKYLCRFLCCADIAILSLINKPIHAVIQPLLNNLNKVNRYKFVNRKDINEIILYTRKESYQKHMAVQGIIHNDMDLFRKYYDPAQKDDCIKQSVIYDNFGLFKSLADNTPSILSAHSSAILYVRQEILDYINAKSIPAFLPFIFCEYNCDIPIDRFYDKFASNYFDSCTFKSAVVFNRFDFIKKYATSHNARHDTFIEAIKNNNYEIVEYLRPHILGFDISRVSNHITLKMTNLLKKYGLIDSKFFINIFSMKHHGAIGDLESIKYVFENRGGVLLECIGNLIKYEHMDCIKYILDTKIGFTDFIYYSIFYGKLNIFKWILKLYPKKTTNYIKQNNVEQLSIHCIEKNYFEMYIHCIENNMYKNPENMLKSALEHGRITAIKMLRKKHDISL